MWPCTAVAPFLAVDCSSVTCTDVKTFCVIIRVTFIRCLQFKKLLNVSITHAGRIASGVGRAFSRVCLFVRALKGKRLELSTPNLVHIYPTVVAWHALTHRSKVKVTRLQKLPRSLVTRAAMAVCCCCRRGSACRYDCLCFLVIKTLV